MGKMRKRKAHQRSTEVFIIVKYDCIIVGGGIAGLQAAIQLGRYQHQVLVVDSGTGRSSICRSFHNVLGYPNGVSGPELRRIGREHGEKLGVHFVEAEIVGATVMADGFRLTAKDSATYEGARLLFATGLVDHIPDIPGLQECLGLSVYVCPDCDGYEVKDHRTIVIGAGDVGANMAITLTYWTKDIVYVNHEKTEISDKLLQQLRKHGIEVIEEAVSSVESKESMITSVTLETGEQLTGARGFVAMGGNVVKSSLATQIGVTILPNHHISVDPRTKMTNVDNVWAAGDVVAHSEQVTIAMGEGSQAAIWIHKSLMKSDA